MEIGVRELEFAYTVYWFTDFLRHRHFNNNINNDNNNNNFLTENDSAEVKISEEILSACSKPVKQL